MKLAPNLNLQGHQKKVIKNIILESKTLFKKQKEAKAHHFIII